MINNKLGVFKFTNLLLKEKELNPLNGNNNCPE
jgi:hypothetical protein